MNGGRTADISLVGYYGILNPNVLWILNRRPDLLSRSPAELRMALASAKPPICGHLADRLDAKGRVTSTVRCASEMKFRYIDGRPAYVCYDHAELPDSIADVPPDVPLDREQLQALMEGHKPNRAKLYIRWIPLRKPKMEKLPDFDLWAELGAALEGRRRELFWEEGEWKLRDA